MKAKEEEEIRKVKEKATKHVLEETNLETVKLSTSRDNSEKIVNKKDATVATTENEEEMKHDFDLGAIKIRTSEADKEMKIALEEAEKQKVKSQELSIEKEQSTGEEATHMLDIAMKKALIEETTNKEPQEEKAARA